jgi:hypothetical protein
MQPIFRGKVEKGKLLLDDPSRYLVRIASLEGKKIELTLKKSQETRSLQSNRYYWGVVVKVLADHCGYDSDEMHEALKFKFLSDKCMDDKGLVRIGSTASLTVDEFIQYTNKVVMWAAQDLQVYIPDPTQVAL